MADSTERDGRNGGGESDGGVGASLEAVVQQMPAGVMIAEAPSGRIVLCNRRIDEIWRGPVAAADDVSGYLDWDGFHSDGRPLAAREWPIARAVLDGETVQGEEIVIRRGDGSRGIVCIDATPIRDGTGRVTSAVATFADVTEERRQERTRQFLNEATSVLAGSLDYETTLRNVARLAVPTLGDWCGVDILLPDGTIERLAAEHVDPVKGKRVREGLERFPFDPEATGGVARVLRTGKPEVYAEVDEAALRTVAHDDQHLAFLQGLRIQSAMILPLTARGRALGAMIFISIDPARRYRPRDLDQATELAFRAGLAIDNARLYHESQAANRAKSDFLAVISHELRTPLTAIIGYAELLGLGVPEPMTERQCEQVERIEVSAQHLMHLIEEILGLVSLEGGKTRLRTAEVRLGDLIQRVRVIISTMAEAKGLELDLEVEDPDLRVETDADHLVQVILNLLTNGIKFTDSGAVRLVARGEAGELRIEVRDSGVGIGPDDLERIFDPFWQAEQPITRRAGGTGLGLTVTRRLLELLGGRIEVESAPGEGSVFRVSLPLRPLASEPR